MKSKVIFVDVDNTICTTESTNYENAQPLFERIQIINSLYDEGNTVIYWTARGTLSGRNYLQLTKQQLTEWKCKYHDVRVGKPFYDLFIDDKNINSEKFFEKK